MYFQANSSQVFDPPFHQQHFKMDANKISLLQSLKNHNQQKPLQLQHVLCIMLERAISVQQARRYILHAYPSLDFAWNTLEDEELQRMAHSANEFVTANRKMWKQEKEDYKRGLTRYMSEEKKIKRMGEINQAISKTEMRDKLKLVLAEREEILQKGENHEEKSVYRAQNQQLRDFITLLSSLLSYEAEDLKWNQRNDKQYDQIIDQMCQKYSSKRLQQNSKEKEQKEATGMLEEYERKRRIIMKRLEQAFLFYSRENSSTGLTFQDYNKTSQLLDLRLFLKYYKDFGFQQANKFRFKVSTATQLFKNEATNGLSLTSKQFWNVHSQLFDLSALDITRRNIIQADQSTLSGFKTRWQEEISKMKELSDIVNEQKCRQKLNIYSVKTENSSGVISESKLIRSPSNADSKIKSNNSSKYYQNSAFSSRANGIRNRNFIQEVREEIMNEQTQSARKIERSQSLFGLNSIAKKPIAVHLPKILKITPEEISQKGIYASLKHFANYDFVAQQKKLKDIIGLSMGEDEEYINSYLKREIREKQIKQKQKSVQREKKRKQIIESLIKKQDYHKFHSGQVQPSMKFS